MSPADHRRARRLIEDYLDPRRAWGAEADRRLREHLCECEACAELYGEAVEQHRLLTTGDVAVPSGFERRRMAEAAVALIAGAPERAAAGLPRWVGALAGACAALVLVLGLGGIFEEPAPDDLRPRGPGDAAVMRPLVGLDLSGVTEGGDEYEVVASSSVGLGDWLRFYYSNERPELRFLAVVGGQPGGTPIVYLPFPGHGDESAAIEVGRFKKLPFEHRLKVLHTPGPLRLVALFTGRPVSRARLEALRAELLAEGSEEELREELGLEESDALHVLLTNVRGERALKQGVSEGNSRGRGVLLQNTPPRKRGEK